MDNCIFCKLIANQIQSYTLHEDDSTRAFLDIMPSAPGHTIVILKRHGLSIHDYEEYELGSVMNIVQKLAKKIEKSLKCDWISIGINHLEPTGVPHLHVHIIPRWKNDSGGAIQSIVKNKPKEQLEVIADKIKKS